MASEYTVAQVKVHNGRFTIPAAIRRRYGIEPGSKVTFVGLGNAIYLLPAIPEEVLHRWHSLKGAEAVRMARWIVETYRWTTGTPAHPGAEIEAVVGGERAEEYAFVAVATVSPKGQVVIPAPLRMRMNGHAGHTANIVVAEDDALIVLTFEDPIETAFGMLAGGPDYLGLLIEEHQQELANERILVD